MTRRHLPFPSFCISCIVCSCLIVGCGPSTIEWPPDTGYVSSPKHRPAQPHQVDRRLETVAHIHGVNEEGRLLLGHFSIDVQDGREYGHARIIFPGTTLVIRTSTSSALTLEDYNGDECVLPHGIHVQVDEYGQFVPLKRDQDRENASAMAARYERDGLTVAPLQRRADNTEKNVPSSTESLQRDVSIVSLSESTILIDDREFRTSDGLGNLADYLGPPDRTSGRESETWIWDRNGISASGTAESIDSFVVAFDPGGPRGSSPRGSFSGKVIVQGRGDLPAVTINAGSDKELVSSARKLHRGFGSSHDAVSGSLIDIQASFITAEESDKLNESPLLRSKYGDQQSHEPEPAAKPDSTGKRSPPAG